MTLQKTAPIWCLTAIITAAFFILGCSKDSPLSDKDSETGDITTGPPVSYTVSSSTSIAVQDSVSGCSFVFPEGGSGTLSVAAVTSSPDLELAATKVTVEYDGAEPVEILVPETSGGENIVFVYTKPAGIATDNIGDSEASWWGLAPAGERDGATAFVITPFMNAAQTAKTAGKAETANTVLAIASVTTASPQAERMAALRQSVQQCVAWWLDNLPPDLAATARTLVEGDLRYDIAFTNEGNCYDHTRRTFGPDAVIELCMSDNPDKAANVHTAAHEVGHYMNHVLVGYDRYVELLNRMPTNWWGGLLPHGFSDYFEHRRYVIEDYAFLSDALINDGTVDSNDITQPMTRTSFGKGPDERDYPSYEGYGVLMLGSLRRTAPTVYCFWPQSPRADAPVVGAPIADVLGLVAHGARDTNELRQVIQNYLDTRTADRYKLPALLEPIGWSYHGAGKVADKDGNPVAGAHVLSVCQDGAKEYRTYFSTPTLADGSFTLPRIFPGTNILRIYWNNDKDSTDVSYTADWTKLTTERLTMGTFTIDVKPIKTFTFTRTSVPTRVAWGGATAEPYDVAAEITPTATLTATGPGLDITENGLYLEVPINIPVNVKVVVTYAKTIINAGNPFGAIFTVGVPVFNPLWPGSITHYGSTQFTDKRTTTSMECDFTFTSTGDSFNLAMRGTVLFEVGGYENNNYVIYTDSSELISGPGFSFLTK